MPSSRPPAGVAQSSPPRQDDGLSSSPPQPQQQKQHLPSPSRPPPLDRLALRSTPVGPDSHTLPPFVVPRLTPPPPEAHRGVAVAVLKKLVRAQPTRKDGAKGINATATTTATGGASAGAASADGNSGETASSIAGDSSHPLASLQAIDDDMVPFSPDYPASHPERSDDDDEVDGDDACASDSDVSRHKDRGPTALPWWRRILVDAAYRARLTQLSTEAYRLEFRLLRESPEAISGAAGMEQRKVWRERQWWRDDLADPAVPLAPELLLKQPQQRDGGASSVNNSNSNAATSGSQQGTDTAPAAASFPSSSSVPKTASMAPLQDEVEERVVMAQHVVVHVPPHSALSTYFATQHPRAMIRASALDTIRSVALGAMPPALEAAELARQESAVDAHLTTQRRFSRDTPFPAKQQLGKDIQAGRREPPMQTAITSAVLDSAVQRRKKRVEPPSRVWRGAEYEDDHRSANSDGGCGGGVLTESVYPQAPRARAATPPHLRRWLPAKAQDVVVAQRAAAVAEISVRSSAMQPCQVPLSLPPAFPPAAVKAASSHEAAAQGETFAEQQQLRCQEAAEACTDGIENLYGLQYVWRLPLPPSGFLRVSPDPRRAMWPEDTTRVSGQLTHASAGSAHHQHQMQRLARRVNKRTRKLQWLHEMGRRRACYNDLGDMTDSDSADSLSSSSSEVSMARTARTHGSTTAAAPRFDLTAERRRRAAKAEDEATRRQRAARASAAAAVAARVRADTVAPVYDGPLNINIYAELPDRGATAETEAANTAGDGAEAPSRVFLGCFRQSRLLIHYKVYSRALYEEARVRCGPPLTHLTDATGTGSGGSRTAVEGVAAWDAATAALLRHVPRIPFPVLRLQTGPPTLRLAHSRQTPRLHSVRDAATWEGLFPSAKADLTTAAHHAWRALRESALVQQAVRDVYEDLPHDKEGLLDKRTFVLFVLQLLQLFFPTHLAPTTHVAIAEEEWVYRGTTEHVGPKTFHEKFFGFPFIFMRDVAAVTETELVEFWSLLRVCLRAQQAHAEARRRGTAVARPEDILLSAHLLVPLTSLSPPQLRRLLSDPPAPFDPAVYDRFCLLTAAYRSDPQVRLTPPANQLAVACARVEQQLRAQQQEQQQLQQSRLSERAKASAVSTAAVAGAGTTPSALPPPHSTVSALPAGGDAAAGAAAATVAVEAALPSPAAIAATLQRTTRASFDATTTVLLSLTDLLAGGGGATTTAATAAAARSGVENVVQREREEHRRALEAEEKRSLLEHSTYYQKRQQQLYVRAATAVSGIESTTSAWQLHHSDVYEPPVKGTADATPPTQQQQQQQQDGHALTVGPAASRRGGGAEDEDVEDALLDYLDGVPLDVFGGHVSLRERYLLHHKNHQRRQVHELPWLQLTRTASGRRLLVPRPDTTDTTAAAAADGAGQANNKAERREFVRVMRGETRSAEERQRAVAAESARLLDSADPSTRGQDGGGDAAGRPQHVLTTSYATGMYPLRPVQRTLSSIMGPADHGVRAQILEQDDYHAAPAGDGRASDSEETGTEAEAEGRRPDSRGQLSSGGRRTLSRRSSRVAGLASSSSSPSFYATRGRYVRHRSFRRPQQDAAPTSARRQHFTQGREEGDGETGEGRQTALAHRTQSRGQLKRHASRGAGFTASFRLPGTATRTGAAAGGSPVLSRPVSPSTVPVEQAAVRAGVRSFRRPLNALPRPIPAVAFVDEEHTDEGEADAGDEATAGLRGDSTLRRSVEDVSALMGSSHSLFSTLGECHASFLSTATTVAAAARAGAVSGRSSAANASEVVNGGRGGAAAAAAGLSDTDGHFAARLQAQKRRQQTYQRRFNASGKPAGTMKR